MQIPVLGQIAHPPRPELMIVTQHDPNRTLTQLTRIRPMTRHNSILSKAGVNQGNIKASAEPAAVHFSNSVGCRCVGR